MTDTIAPALTPTEWKRHERRLSSYSVLSWGGSVVVEGPDPQEAVPLTSAPDIAALMAAANAELPADSPYKITREDVALLASAAGAVDSLHCEVCSGACTCAAEEAALNRLAAKLAALLPPDSSLPGHT